MKTQTTKAAIAHRLIVTGESVLNLVWGEADERRAAALEIIARTAYTAEESACHFLETIGCDTDGNIRETLELARWQDTNEQMHEDVFGRDLGGLSAWVDQFLSRHIAVIIYWAFAITTLIDHEFASHLGEAVEVEAVKTYGRMLHEQPEWWLNQPAPRAALEYWEKENTLWSHRCEDLPVDMRDVVTYICRDEADHVTNNHRKASAF